MTPDWISPGTPVVLYNTGGASRNRNVVETTIKKVAGKSFTVDAEDTRFPIDRLHVSQGGTWGWTREVVPADSVTARHVLAEHRHLLAKNRARRAVDDWSRSPSRETRLAAITALQALDSFEPPDTEETR